MQNKKPRLNGIKKDIKMPNVYLSDSYFILKTNNSSQLKFPFRFDFPHTTKTGFT